MAARIGIATYEQDENGTLSASVRLRRRLPSGWHMQRLPGCASADTRSGRSRRALLLPSLSTLVVEGSDADIEERRQRLERFGGRRLVVAHFARRRRSARAVIANLDHVAALPAGARGVPIQFALAALARWMGAPADTTIYFACAGVRCLAPLRAGLPASHAAPGGTCLLLAPPDDDGRALIDGVEPARLLEIPQPALRSLAPIELAAFGAALAMDRPGSFPVRRRTMRVRWGRAHNHAAAALLAALAGWHWHDERADLAPLAESLAQERRQLEEGERVARKLELELRSASLGAPGRRR